MIVGGLQAQNWAVYAQALRAVGMLISAVESGPLRQIFGPAHPQRATEKPVTPTSKRKATATLGVRSLEGEIRLGSRFSRHINDLAWASPTAEVGQVQLPEAECGAALSASERRSHFSVCLRRPERDAIVWGRCQCCGVLGKGTARGRA